MTNFLLLLVLWCLSKPFFGFAVFLFVVKFLINIITFDANKPNYTGN